GSIKQRIRKGNVTQEAPLVFEGRERDGVLDDLTYDFACRLRDASFEGAEEGLLVTFHRDSVPLSDEDAVTAPDIRDEAGVFFENPKIDSLLGGCSALPLPRDVIKYVQIRVAAVRAGIPIGSDYPLFKVLEVEGNLGFGHLEKGLIKTDSFVSATCVDGRWSEIVTTPYSNLGLSPNMQALHYGSAEFEGMTAEIGVDGNVYVFGMRSHYERYRSGAIKLGLKYVTFEVFNRAVITAVQQNARFVPKGGRLYVRQHSADIGPQMRVGNSRVTGFFVEVTPIGGVGAYFGKRGTCEREGNVPIKVLGVPDNKVRAAANQGMIKAIGGYAQTAPVIKAVKGMNLAGEGESPVNPDGVLYLDRVVEGFDQGSDEFRGARVCETNASNTLFFQDLGGGRYKIITPTLAHGDILPGNTRNLVLAQAWKLGWEIEERDVLVGEVMDGKFCSATNCGTAAILSPFDAIHFVHIDEKSIEQDGDPKVPDVSAEKRGSLISIRDQAVVNAEPTPKPVEILLEKILAVKSGNCSSGERERYLTQVPGLRAR
ncbi:MAG: aminotransferase class IV, partial [Candidatus Gracilibacteria bacterium]